MKGTWQTTGSGGDGIGAVVLVVIGAALVAAIAGPIVHAVTDLLEVLAIVLAVILGLAVLALVALVAVRVRRGRSRTLPMVSEPRPVTWRASHALPEPQRPAIEPRREVHIHHHWHGVTAEDVAAIVAEVNRDRG